MNKCRHIKIHNPEKSFSASLPLAGKLLSFALPKGGPVIGLTLTLSAFLFSTSLRGQSITEIITDYQGYWKSSSSSLNPIKPNHNHNLLSFSFNGTRYSTGVDDALLTSQGQPFTAADYRALPVQSINGSINSNTKIGVGSLYDGVLSGPGTPAPVNSLPAYLTDGIKGLNIGTCVANLPAGTLFFSVGNISPSSIGDGIPDVVITQTADPSSSSFDRYQFTDVNGNGIGNYKDIILNNITPVGNWFADFYEASHNPVTLASGFTNTQRPLRLWAADFSEFGISPSDISSIAYFKIILNGNSDVAFVAYNHNAINFSSVLPVQLSSFTAENTNDDIKLSWQTFAETNSDKFLIETSLDGTNFSVLGETKARGYSSNPIKYSYVHESVNAGVHFYRLKQVDLDGASKYSKIIKVEVKEEKLVSVYPNPASSTVMIRHSLAKGNEFAQIISPDGNVVQQSHFKAGSTETKFSVSHLRKGLYFVVTTDANGKLSQPLMLF